MTDTALHTVFVSPEQAKACVSNVIAPYCRERWGQGVEKFAVTVEPLEDERSLRQNRFMWGVVLKEISEQAQIGGVGATPEGWHLYFKRKFLGYKFTKTVLPGKKRPSVTRELRSTTKLSVKAMSAYLEQVIAEAVTVFGVAFSERNWENYR
jgi:hypothetical protein